MEDRKYPIPTWVWELRSRTLSFLKWKRDFEESWNEYIEQKSKPRHLDIDKFLDRYGSLKPNKKRTKP